jgi:Uma2 family endonuclease
MVYDAARATILTPDEFLVHPAANERTELVRGHIRMMTPASAGHGLVSMIVGRLLSTYASAHRLGVCFADSTGYTLPNLPNTVRAPDASFVRADRLPPEGVGTGFHQLAPDLAVEVLSPSESTTDLQEKLDDYRVAGTPLVWVIDPTTRTVTFIASGLPTTTLAAGDTVTGGEVLPGFSCSVSELFEGLAPVAAG